MKNKKIWVIDDDPIYQIIVKKIIEKSEMFTEIYSFKNGKDAIDNLYKSSENSESVPDIILLDINMPIMDGWEFMEELGLIKTNFNNEIVVYIVSSSIAIEDKNKSKSYENILGYLSKPINVNDYPAVKKHLDEFYIQLEKRTDKGDTPYNLRSCAYVEDFDRPKIVYPNMTKFLPFIYDEEGFLTNQKCFITIENYNNFFNYC